MKGYLWGSGSVLLVTAAQLLMKWGMVQLPLFSWNDLHLSWFLNHLTDNLLPLTAVFAGLCGYVLSMLCWFFALHHLPLNRAYPLLSISYVLVYLLAILLPWFSESVTVLKSVGAGLILLGVWLINSKPTAVVPKH